MATLIEELQKVQPCDGRSLIQILTQRIIQEIIQLKKQACGEVANTMQTYGLENIYPCDYLTEEFLQKLLTTEPTEAISSVLVRAGYPPHLLKAFTKGFDQLTDQELQEIIEWTGPTVGIQIHPNTSKYLRTKVETEERRSLNEVIQEVVIDVQRTISIETTEWIDVPLTEEEIEAIDTEFEDRRVFTVDNPEKARLQRLQAFLSTTLANSPATDDEKSRIKEVVDGSIGPKVSRIEFIGETTPTFDKNNPDTGFTEEGIRLLQEAVEKQVLTQDHYKTLYALTSPEEEGGFGETSAWVIYEPEAYNIPLSFENPDYSSREEETTVLNQVTIDTTETVQSSSFEEVTETVETRTGLTADEASQVEQFYIRQGVSNVIRPLTETIGQKVGSLLQCPTPDQSQKLITRIKNLLISVNAVKTTVTSLQQIVNIASALINTLSRIIDILKKVIARSQPLILAAAIIPVTRGIAIILNKIIGSTTELLRKIEPDIEALDKSVCTAAGSLTFVTANINVVDAFLRVLDELLKKCNQDLANSGNPLQAGIAATFTPPPGNPLGSGDIEYRGYKIEVRTKASDETLKRRYAVGIDSNGVVAIEGPLSYSADAEILIEELKYRIDTYLG